MHGVCGVWCVLFYCYFAIVCTRRRWYTRVIINIHIHSHTYHSSHHLHPHHHRRHHSSHPYHHNHCHCCHLLFLLLLYTLYIKNTQSRSQIFSSYCWTTKMTTFVRTANANALQDKEVAADNSCGTVFPLLLPLPLLLLISVGPGVGAFVDVEGVSCWLNTEHLIAFGSQGMQLVLSLPPFLLRRKRKMYTQYYHEPVSCFLSLAPTHIHTYTHNTETKTN